MRNRLGVPIVRCAAEWSARCAAQVGNVQELVERARAEGSRSPCCTFVTAGHELVFKWAGCGCCNPNQDWPCISTN
jgi:hypothetical protein